MEGERNTMKKLSKEMQMQMNGGAQWWHCHKCNRDFCSSNKTTATKDASKHVKNHNGGYRYWDYEMLKYCGGR